MNLFKKFWKKSNRPKIIYKTDFKLTKRDRRELRKFLRANGIVGAVITHVTIPGAPQISEQEVYYLYSKGKVKQA